MNRFQQSSDRNPFKTHHNSRRASLNPRRVTAWLLLVVFFVSVFPVSPGGEWGMTEAEAQTKATVTVENAYNTVGGTRSEKFITISEDFRLFNMMNRNLEVGTIPANVEGELTNIVEGATSMRAQMPANWNVEYAQIEGVKNGNSKLLTYSGITESDTPEILSIDQEVVEAGDTITIRGNNLAQILNENQDAVDAGETEPYQITVGGVTAAIEQVPGDANALELSGNFPNGRQDIVMRYRSEKPTFRNGEPDGEYLLRNLFNYRQAVRIIATLNLDGITMFPNIGEVGSQIRFTREQMSQNGYDVYLVRDLNDLSQFNENTLAEPIGPPVQSDGEYVFTVTVPDVPTGQSYFVVLTQPGNIDSRYVMDEQFRVVRISERPYIQNVNPLEAPSLQPTDVNITGGFFSKLNIPGLDFEVAEIDVPDLSQQGVSELTIEYIHEEGEDPVFNLGGGNIAAVERVTRTFRVVIDQPLRIHSFSPMEGDGSEEDNTFRVRTESVTIDQPTAVPVTIEVFTSIELEEETDRLLEQFITYEEPFTFIPSTENPVVDEVLPTIIPIEAIGEVDYLNSSLGELMIVVKGENFLVTRFREDGDEKINQPKIKLGNTIINPNIQPEEAGIDEYVPTRYQVLRDNVEVTGIGDNETGNTIVFFLNAGPAGFIVTDRNDRSVSILNPRRRSSEFPSDDFFISFPEKVSFEYVDENDFPVIENVTPNLVALEGGIPIRVTGSNFRPQAIVYIEGEPVPNITISGDNTQIEFVAPPGSRAGETQLQVVNPGGGLDTHPFTYTTTFTEPVLTNISPAEGTEGTLVTAQGDNFLRQDPTVRVNDFENNRYNIDAFIINRLIGTRFFIGGHDINEYNRSGNRTVMEPYHEDGTNLELKEPVFVYNENVNQWRSGEGFDSVIFHDRNSNKFYRLSRNIQNQYFIEDGLGLRYEIRYAGNDQFEAVSGNAVHEIQQEPKGTLTFDNKTLRAYTPYRMESINGYTGITGDRTEYINSSTLRVRVPYMGGSPWSGDGLYDVSVVNPDTREATLQNAFYYYLDPQTTPAVSDIVPDLGPEQGGNLITLYLNEALDVETGFTDTGTSKTKVFIGAQQVPAEDVVISPGGNEIRLSVPAYQGNIREEGTNRLTVPMVLVNPDGGTFHIDYQRPITVERTRRTEEGSETYQTELFGYTYVVPSSNPRIDRIAPAQGSAAGRFVVELFGFDFRNFRNIRDDDGNITGTIRADSDLTAPSAYIDEYEVLIDELYPQIYFGNREVELLEFSSTYMQVVVGPGDGTVPVYVVNNDSGISNSLNFTFEGSQPQITSVNPARGDRRGGTLVEILGQDFEEGIVTKLLHTFEENSPSERESEELTMVRVGNRTNENLPRENDNAGIIRSSRATVTLPGELRVHYNANPEDGGSEIVEVSIQEQGEAYTRTYRGLEPGEEVFIDTTDLTKGAGEDAENYPYRELIRLKVDDNRLIVEGGYAPAVLHRSPRHIVATMPAYYTTGNVRLSVINPDRGSADGNFEYITPDSDPVITNITREGRDPVEEDREGFGTIRVQKISARGGNVISIHGTDFREDARIEIGNVLNIGPDDIEYNLPTRLTFTMPEVPEDVLNELQRVVVLNTDGGSATSDRAEPTPVYVEFIRGESDPRLDTIAPQRGPVTGGTRVTLRGNDFRQEMEGYSDPLSVFFGEARVEDGSGNLEYTDYRQVEVTVPASETFGTVNVRLENPDGELSLPPAEYEYISQPNIENLDPPRIFANDPETEIVLTGDMFMTGAVVILGGRLVPINEVTEAMNVLGQGIRGVDGDGNNREFAVVDGVAANNVTVESENVMRVQFPETLDLENDNMIIINPDDGLSDPDDAPDFDYDIPIPDAPLVLEAVPGSEGSMHLIWSESDPGVLNAAESFEIYGKRSSQRDYTFIASTEEADYLIRNLHPDTRYDFRVRALNEYGSAIESAEVRARTLRPDQDPKLEEKLDELDRQRDEQETQGSEEIINGTVVRTVGSREIPAGFTPYVIDFSGADYSRYNEFVVAFPVENLSRMNRPVTITDGTGSLTITPNTLYTRQVSSLSVADSRDGVARVHFTRMQGNDSNTLSSAVERTQRRASAPYNIGFSLNAGRSAQSLPRLMGSATMNINLDSGSYPGSTTANTAIGTYNPATHRFQRNNSTTATLREPGMYMLIQNR